MKTFHQVLINALIVNVTNNFVWFALTFFAYLETQSVLATSLVSGIYLTTTALSGFWFGSIVDHNKKKVAMLYSSVVTLLLFTLGFALFEASSPEAFKNINSSSLWSLVLLLLFGVIAGNVRNISMPTLVTLLVPENLHDKANGLSGTVTGIAFAITSVGSGLALAYTGMRGVLLISIIMTIVSILHLALIHIQEDDISHNEDKPTKIDIRGTLKVIKAVPGLLALIFFSTFNNFLGGVYMSLMDAYGLTLVSVEVWGFLWGFLSLGFIFGGLIVARKGLGPNPLRTLFIANGIMWFISILLTIHPWIGFLTIGMLIWICLIPFVEASEQTIMQKVVPYERQGRVFGFAQSVEQAASPLTAFLIGPIAQYIFIPFVTTGAGVDLIGDWWGVGTGRGIALVFTVTGIIGFIVTVLAIKTRSYKLLEKRII